MRISTGNPSTKQLNPLTFGLNAIASLRVAMMGQGWALFCDCDRDERVLTEKFRVNEVSTAEADIGHASQGRVRGTGGTCCTSFEGVGRGVLP